MNRKIKIKLAADDVLSCLVRNNDWITGFIDQTFINYENSTEMALEAPELCEITMKSWDSAINSCLREISLTSFPNSHTLYALFNCILNDCGISDFGSLTEIFDRLLEFHPPNSQYMKTYYLRVLTDCYAQVSSEGVEKEPFFWILLELMSVHYSNAELTEEVNWQHESEQADSSFRPDVSYHFTPVKNQIRPYNKLPAKCQYMRISICLSIVCDILEADLIARVKNFDKGSCISLFESLIWPSKMTGYANINIKRIIAFCFTGKLKKPDSFQRRILRLLAVIIYLSDYKKDMVYPFISSESENLAREVSLELFLGVTPEEDTSRLNYLTEIEPTWFRMLIANHILGKVAGFACPPTLASVEAVLELLFNKTQNRKRKFSDKLRERHLEASSPCYKTRKGNTMYKLQLTINNLVQVVHICLIFTQSYLATYQTVSVKQKMQSNQCCNDSSISTTKVNYDASRYQKDIYTNLPRLKILTTKLMTITELKPFIDQLHFILS